MRSYSIFLILILMIACTDSKRPDISTISYKISIYRTEMAIFDQKKPFNNDALYDFYLNRVIVLSDSSEYDVFKEDENFNKIANDVKTKFTNFDVYENQLEKSIKYYLYYFPDAEIPQFFTMITGFAYPLVFDENKIGIGLDYFLGEDYPTYSNFLPNYLIRKTNPENLVPMTIEAFLQQQVEEPVKNATFLDLMIYEGKLLVLMDLLLPEMDDRLKITYTPEQLNWVKSNERDIWALFIQEDLLFTSDELSFDKYFSEGPFTSGLAPDSAPKLGTYIGWQIIRKYIQETGKIPSEWIHQTDAQEILKIANYRP